MLFRILFLTVLLASPFAVAEPTALDYKYTGSASDPDLSKLKAPLTIGEFTDSRSDEDKTVVFTDSDELQLDQPVAEVIADAFQQAFIKNGARIADADAAMRITGELTELYAVKDGEYTVQLRSKVNLQNNGRSIWNSVLFSRASGPTLADALRSSIDKLVQELLIDDYFLMEVI